MNAQAKRIMARIKRREEENRQDMVRLERLLFRGGDKPKGWKPSVAVTAFPDPTPSVASGKTDDRGMGDDGKAKVKVSKD